MDTTATKMMKVEREIGRRALLAALALAATLTFAIVACFLGAAPARAGVTSPAEKSLTNPNQIYLTPGMSFGLSQPIGGAPYSVENPSRINVSGYSEEAGVDDVTVTLHGVDEYYGDLVLLLQNPSGDVVRLIESCDDYFTYDSGTITLTLDDAAPTSIPLSTNGATILPGTYKPTQCSNLYQSWAGRENPPLPASAGTELAYLDGTKPNETWGLFMLHNGRYLEPAYIYGGWTLNLSAHTPTDPWLGRYPDTKVAEGDDVTITPSRPPKNATELPVEASDGFTGGVSIDHETGAVQVSNPGPLGDHTLTVEATGEATGEVQTQPIALMVKRHPEHLVVDTPLMNESNGCFTGHCTLAEAVERANTNDNLKPDTISFDPEVFSRPQTIQVPRPTSFGYVGLVITDDVTVDGPGADKLTIDGQGGPGSSHPVSVWFLERGGDSHLTLQDMTVTGARAEKGITRATLAVASTTARATPWICAACPSRATGHPAEARASTTRALCAWSTPRCPETLSRVLHGTYLADRA
ncbi:MAG: hypothetical protein H0T91_01650 [Propionibacteriaceae bacterium]|nr:hypothetical protein [Propionibacteriaceae bacterium]